MGARASTTSKTINKTLTETIIDLSKRCGAEAANVLSLKADNVGGSVNIGGKVKQEATTQINCEQRSDIVSAIQSQMATKMASEAVAKGGFTSTTARVRNEVVNEVINKTDVTDLMECFTDSTNVFEAHFGTVSGDFSFTTEIDQTASADVSSCIQDTGIDQEIATEISTAMASKAESDGSINFSLFGGLGAVIVLLIIAVIAFKLVKSKKAQSAAPSSYSAQLANVVMSAKMASQRASKAAYAASSLVH